MLAALFRGQGCRENRVGLPSSTKEVAPTPHRPPLAPIATAHYEGRPGVMMMLPGTRTLLIEYREARKGDGSTTL